MVKNDSLSCLCSGRIAGCGLQAREWTLPLRQDLQRRELEPATARAAHPARRQRQSGRLLAGGEWPRRALDRQCLQLLRKHSQQAGRNQSRAEPRRHGSREVTVVPLANEAGLRNLDWIEGNRRKVDQTERRKLAYVYCPNTGGGGYTSFNRYFFSQTQKDGAVIDERFNGGGSLADYIVEYLAARCSTTSLPRRQRPCPTPMGAIYGPKAMIINELAGSGGDALPWYFRKMKIGPLVGKRTGEDWSPPFRAPQLMDGGLSPRRTPRSSALTGAVGSRERRRRTRHRGRIRSGGLAQGRDPQLEKAVEVLLAS